jgi:prepilin-type N-terminal cleavage/methylation domain-containing protein
MQQGFTLIEILVVIVIMGIAASIVIFNIGLPSYYKFKSQVDMVSNTLSVISDQAIYTGRTIICKIDSNNIVCKQYVDEEWVDMDFNKIISWKWPPEKIKFKQLTIEGLNYPIGSIIAFVPSGDNAKMSLEITSEDGKFTSWIDSDLLGRYNISN